MCCNNFGYFTNMLSQIMLPMLMMRSIGGGSYCSPNNFYRMGMFPQNYSYIPCSQSLFVKPSYSLWPVAPYVNNTQISSSSLDVTDYFSFLDKNSLVMKPETQTDIVDVNVDVNGKKLSPFAAFEKMCDVAEDLGYEKSKTHKEEKHGVLMVDEQWRKDANAGKDNLEARYMELVKKFGKDFIKGVDKKHGDGNGTLSYSEFEAYQLEDLPSDADAETKKEMKDSIRRAYNRMNINGGETIDEYEMTAFLAAMDYDKNNNVNGRITVDNYTYWSVKLAQEGKNDLDTLLKERYRAFFDTNA